MDDDKKRLDRGWLYTAIKDLEIPSCEEVNHILERDIKENTDDSMYTIEIFLDDDYS